MVVYPVYHESVTEYYCLPKKTWLHFLKSFSCTYCCPCVAMFVGTCCTVCVVCSGNLNDVSWFTLFGNAACMTVVGLYFAFLSLFLESQKYLLFEMFKNFVYDGVTFNVVLDELVQHVTFVCKVVSKTESSFVVFIESIIDIDV